MLTRRRGDDGTVLLLTLCYAVLALVLIVGVIDVTVFYLARRDLQTVADGAALTAAQQLSSAGAYGTGHLDPSPDAVAAVMVAYADAYVAGGGRHDVQWTDAEVVGDSVVVVVRRQVEVPFAGAFAFVGFHPVTTTVTATAHAHLTCPGGC